MKKIILIYLLSHLILIGNVVGKPTPESKPTKYDKNTDNISKEDNKINDKIITNTDNIITNKDNITTNYNKNKTQDLDIQSNKNRIVNNSSRLDNHENRISKLEETQTIIGLKGRIYDSKKWQVNIFADYSTNRNKVDRTGIRFTYKFGSSFEERKILELEKIIKEIIYEK